ncbi:MAG: HAMP domain-containing sensor histidine kinase [Acetivibrio sp.]
MKHSIRVRLSITLAALIGSTIFLCWIINKTFLPEYYQQYKVAMLGKAYQTVGSIYTSNGAEEETLDSEISLALESLGANQSLGLYVFRLYQNQVGLYADFLYPKMDVIKQNQVLDQILAYTGNGKETEEREVLRETDAYKIVKVFDKRMDSYYLELFGVIDEVTGIYIRSNYQSMMESVSISNRFLAYIGVLATFIGITIMYIISRSFTNPILELSAIANRMSRLDFDVKYQVKRKDELGMLGNSINVLSEKLEETISELKSANNELQKDIEKKTKIDEMRTEFLSNVSHELKTPIALIQGYAEGLMENVNEDEESRQFYCEVITDEAMKMNEMVKKLLSLNHIEFGENANLFERFDITAIIGSVLASTEILFQQKEVILRFEEKEPVYVWADEYMVEEVITNYISNALNHVDGKRIVEVKIVNTEGKVRIAVFNTGARIPDEDIDRIWDKFYKVDKARTREYGGSGIGLSIVKAIMISLNQKFGVVNHETGVEFWFELDCKN